MTPVESMKETVVNAVDTALRITKQILADGYTYNSPEAFVTELRTLGFTIVPIEPTDARVRQVRALPEIMAALREWAEADAALADACDPENRRHFGKEMSAMAQADAALLALYERLK